MSDSYQMIELLTTIEFDVWLRRLRDRNARLKITARMLRLASGNPGDVKPIGEGLSEVRVNYGPGYRIYYMRRGPVIIILLWGGDKSTQQQDIAKAKLLASEWKDEQR
jgi:putative addiction module killer protein